MKPGTEVYANAFGGNDGPSTFSGFSNEDERCQPGPSTPLSVPKVCYAGMDQGCRAGLSPSQPWEAFYADSDPNTCRPSIQQHRLMLMKRAGINTVRLGIPWGNFQTLPDTIVNFHPDNYNLDAYVIMAGAYGMEIEGDFGGFPTWGSTCCIQGESEEQCRRRTARLSDCGIDCGPYPNVPEENKACCADKKRAQDPACDLVCLQNEVNSRQWLSHGSCVPGVVTSLNPETQPDYGPFKSFVEAAVKHFAPGGELAQAHPSIPGIGIRNWGLGNEIENPRNFLRIRPDPTAVNDPGHPGLQYYLGLKEYKQLVKEMHDLIRIELGRPDHRIHGPGPNITAGASGADCDYYDAYGQHSPDGVITSLEFAERCHDKISFEHIYQVMRDPAVGGFSLSEGPFANGIVLNFHWYQQEGPNPNANEKGARQRQEDALRSLSCMFPGMPVWANEGGNCDQQWALARQAAGLDMRECHPDYVVAPSALAQAGYLVGVSSYLGPKTYTAEDCATVNGRIASCTDVPYDHQNCACPEGKTCPLSPVIPSSPASRKFERLFWYRPADGGRGLFELIETGASAHILRPVYHAISPAQPQTAFMTAAGSAPIEFPFRTGVDRETLQPKALFNLSLKAGQTVSVLATGKNLSTGEESRNLGIATYVLDETGETVGVIYHKDNDPELYPHINEGQFSAWEDGVYTVEILPHKLPPYVPTEGETPLRDINGETVPHRQGGRDDCDVQTDTSEVLSLSLTAVDSLVAKYSKPQCGGKQFDVAALKREVLRAAEGAYVEGTIRFNLVGSGMGMVARRTRAP